MDSPETPLQLEEALKMYSNLSVKRWAIGNVTIWEKMEGDSEREISLGLFRDIDTHEWDNLHIDAKTTPQETREKDYDKDTALRLKLQKDGIALVVRDRGESHDPLEVIEIAKKGLDLLDAYIHADDTLRAKYADRIQDDAEHAEERLKKFPQISAELEFAKELRSLGVTLADKDPQPRERYRVMRNILQRPVVSTKRT